MPCIKFLFLCLMITWIFSTRKRNSTLEITLLLDMFSKSYIKQKTDSSYRKMILRLFKSRSEGPGFQTPECYAETCWVHWNIHTCWICCLESRSKESLSSKSSVILTLFLTKNDSVVIIYILLLMVSIPDVWLTNAFREAKNC